jgi:hypothetical protein
VIRQITPIPGGIRARFPPVCTLLERPIMRALLLLGCSLFLGVSACGSDDSSNDGTGAGGSQSTGGTNSGGSSTGGSSTGGSSTGGSSSGGAPTGGNGGTTTGGSGGTGGSGSTPATGDRYVATDGTDSGDCSTNPCKTLSYAGQQLQSGEVLVMKDGSYPDSVDSNTLPKGTAGAFTVVRAEHDGAVTITGSLELHQNADFFLEFQGMRFESSDSKGVAGGNVRFLRVAFIGGPATGNTVSFGVGTNDFQPGAWDVLCEDCIFRGLGGRYAALVYRGENVTFRRIVARKDGGWGIGSSGATNFEPEGVIVFYETKNSTCEKCVALDSLKESHSSAEALGSIIQNSHTNQHTNVTLSECFAVNNEFAGFSFEGNGSVGTTTVSDSYSADNSANGFTANVDGNITLTRIASLSNDGTGVASYGDATVTLTDSKVSGNGETLNGVSGSTTGAGPHVIDLSQFDNSRLKSELCDLAQVSRGYCADGTSFQDYLQSFF